MQMPDVLTIHNGGKNKPTFTAQEYQTRIASLRKVMVELDIDACLFTSYHNINYYSDFIYCQFGRPYGLVVTADKTTLIVANIDGGQPWRKAVVDDVLTYTDWRQGNFYRALKQCLPNAGLMGLELDHMTVARHQELSELNPRLELVDISQPCMQLRMIKSDNEIELISQGAQVCDIGGGAVVDALGENVPEYIVALASTEAMVREIANRYPDSELMDSWTWFQSGINTDGAHNPVTSRKIQRGDILSLNCFSMISGYYTALERTLFFGQPSEEQLRIWQVNCAVHDAGKALLKPGVRCSEVARELNAIYQQHGILEHRTFGYGHSFGVLSHYYGREAGLELREDVDTVLQPNMVISMEPMVMFAENSPAAGGYREHDILVITEQGNRNLTAFPYGPEHNIYE